MSNEAVALNSETPAGRVSRQPRQLLAKSLRWAAFACLVLLAASLPFSIKAAVLFFRLTALFWTAWLVLRLLRREKLKLQTSPLVAPLLVFLILLCLSTMFSYEPRLSWGRMRTFSLLFVAVLVSQIPRSYRETKVLVGVLLFAVAVNLGHTAWQYTYGTGVKLTNLSTTGPLARAGLIRDDVVQAVSNVRVHSPGQLLRELNQGSPSDLLEVQIARGAPTEHWTLSVERAALSELSVAGATGRGRPVRAQGFFRHYIPYAEFLALFGTLAFAFAVAHRNHPRWVKIGFAALVAAVVAALIFTATRAALGALLIAAFAALYARSGKIPRLVGIGAALLITVAAFVWFEHARGSWESQDAGTHYRTLMWSDGLRLARQHPWLGVGMDSVHNHWNKWGIRAYQQYPHLKSHFHSSYVQLAVECGVPALAAWLWFLGSFLWMGYAMCKQSVRDAFLDSFGLAALGSAIAVAALGVLHYVLGDSEAMMLFALIVGLTWWIYAYRLKTIETSEGEASG